MPRPDEKGMKRLCSGCYCDRYNHRGLCERPGIDAPVTSERCWSLKPEHCVYVRGAKRWVMTCHSGHYQRWLTEWHETGKKPTWNPY